MCQGNKIKPYGKFQENTKKIIVFVLINKIKYIYASTWLLHRVSYKLFSSIIIIRISLLLMILYYTMFLKLYFFNLHSKLWK